VDSLKESCEAILIKDIDDETVLIYLGIAEQFTVKRLKVRTTDSLASFILHSLPRKLEEIMLQKLTREREERTFPFLSLLIISSVRNKIPLTIG